MAKRQDECLSTLLGGYNYEGPVTYLQREVQLRIYALDTA